MSIIDYYSRNVWIYILKNKSDTFNKFKEYKILIENQVGRNVKRLKTNNGLEYLSTKFNELCNKEGIIRHNIVRKNPQQNGLVENMNRIILERVRCMLSILELLKSFWAEVAITATYLINRCSFSAINFKIS